MSTLRNDEPAHDEVHREQGELRRPGDRTDQPGQGADLTPPHGSAVHENSRPDADVRGVGGG